MEHKQAIEDAHSGKNADSLTHMFWKPFIHDTFWRIHSIWSHWLQLIRRIVSPLAALQIFLLERNRDKIQSLSQPSLLDRLSGHMHSQYPMVYSQQQCLDCQNFRCSRLCRTIKHTLGNSSGKKLENAYSSLSSLLYDDTLQLKSIDKKNIVV